jgi:hypothetical protein
MKQTKSEIRTISFAIIYLISFVFIISLGAQGVLAQNAGKTLKNRAGCASPIEVRVDPRIELLGIIFRLAGNGEFNHKVKKYSADVDTHFAEFRDHPAVQYARRMREERKICCDAVMSLAIHLGDLPEIKQRRTFRNSTLEKRWQIDEAGEFVEKIRDFVKDSDFHDFIRANRSLYELTETRMRNLINEKVNQKWFEGFFGERPKSRFILTIGLLNGGWNYGMSFQNVNGSEELHAMMGVWLFDEEGNPKFDERIIPTVVHEFNHSFINHIVAKREAWLRPAGEIIYAPVAVQMRGQGYTSWKTMIDESLVRAAVARYILAHQGTQAAAEEVERQKLNGFLWTDELYALLGVYENNRRRYPTFESFFPNIEAYFRDLAPRINIKIAQFEARRPRVISMTPLNEAEDVDPDLTEIKFTFDRPMKRDSQAMITLNGRQDQFPEIRGPGKFWEFDETGTVYTMRVRLKPNWTYEFALNSERTPGFQSTEGIPLKPYRVRFKTGSARN